jgi:uncharacterized protein
VAADTISLARARRLALGAQGFASPRPAETGARAVGTRQLNLLIERLGLLQIDSVNVYERSHYLPVFARLGPYDKALLDRIAFAGARRSPRYFEYWGHAATLLPIEVLPLMRHRMERLSTTTDWAKWGRAHAPMMDWLVAELAEKGPMTASEIEHEENRRTGPWWGWSDVKTGLETLLAHGRVFSAGRTRFERRYGLAEQVLPPGALDLALPKEDAERELIRRSVVALGIGTADDIRDYYRLPYLADAKSALRDLVDAGSVREVRVEGWGQPAYLDPAATVPRRIETTALLSPFDPIVWYRDRGRRLWGFDYTIEIYLKPHDRRFGYYTQPLLVDEALAGRIDLKSDRQRGVLMVQSAWTEPGAPAEVEQRVAELLRTTAAWQGLDGGIEVADWGDLAPRLAGALGVSVTPRR